MKPARLSSLFLIPILTMQAFGQVLPADTTIIFQPANPEILRKSLYQPLLNAWGFDLLISNNGFGAGIFYRRELSDEFAGFLNLAISDVKDEAEFERYDYLGNPFVYGKKNRLLFFPLAAGIQYRLFTDDIVDNFRPYVTAAIGPTMVFVAPYSRRETFPLPGGGTATSDEPIEFFSSLKSGQAKYTLGGFIGFGAYFGMEKGSLSGINIRYYIAPFPNGIEVMYGGGIIRNFGGFYITLNFGSLY
ncbi:MAG: hypothetical protein HYY49_11620 [Ignavibacteriales bacterium]|nr:hypothetical protein [Ignavibacteriales bacterium]